MDDYSLSRILSQSILAIVLQVGYMYMYNVYAATILYKHPTYCINQYRFGHPEKDQWPPYITDLYPCTMHMTLYVHEYLCGSLITSS